MKSAPVKISDIINSPCGHLNGHLEMPGKVKGKSKYKNIRVELDGHKFDSKKEANRYIALQMLQTAGEISNLRLQVPYELNEGGSHSLKYVADFVYLKNGVEIVEDVKGFRTAVYLKKKKLMKKLHRIYIFES